MKRADGVGDVVHRCETRGALWALGFWGPLSNLWADTESVIHRQKNEPRLDWRRSKNKSRQLNFADVSLMELAWNDVFGNRSIVIRKTTDAGAPFARFVGV